MMISREKILLRRSLISQTLVDEIYSGTNDQLLLQLQQTHQFSDDVLFAIEKKCQYVLLGFLRTKDLFEELVQEVKLDSKTALAVYQAVDEKIFSRLRSDIEDTYKLFQAKGVVSDAIISPIQTKEQVVLRKEVSPETVTLSFQETPPMQMVMNQEISAHPTSQVTQTTARVVDIPASLVAPTPSSISVPQARVIPSPPQNQVPTPSKVESYSSPNQNIFHTENRTSNISAVKTNNASDPTLNTKQQTVSPSLFAVPNTTVTTEGPMVLHKKEEVSSVGQSTAGRTYRQMSFGSFMGAFKTPQNKETNISRAEIEMPEMNQSNNVPLNVPSQQVPFSVKKYETPSFPQQREQAKVVHYTFEDTSSHTDSISPTPNSK